MIFIATEAGGFIIQNGDIKLATEGAEIENILDDVRTQIELYWREEEERRENVNQEWLQMKLAGE